MRVPPGATSARGPVPGAAAPPGGGLPWRSEARALRYSTLFERVGNATRLLEVLQVLVRNGFAHLVRAAGLTDGLPAKLLTDLRILEAPSREPETMGRRMRRVLEQLGPTFVKLGQMMAGRTDLFPEDLVAELGKLHEKAASFPAQAARRIIEEDTGRPLEQLYATLPDEARKSFSSGLADDLLDQLVARLQGEFGVTVNEAAIQRALSF